MSDELNSRHWYRVTNLKPRLHDQIEIHRHDYRDQIWYVLENTTTGRSHRFNVAAYQFIGMLDGEREVHSIYDQVCEKLGEDAPGQGEIINLMCQLYEADLLKIDDLSDSDELFERRSRRRSSELRQRFTNPVAIRVPLWDPEQFLNRHYNKVKWLFNAWAGTAWVVLLIYSLLQMAQHWPQIEYHFGVNALSPYNLILLFLLYPVIKLLHELGHAFAAKLEGGEVHEMGITFLLLMPVPYVNVSAATHFRSRFKRMLVSAAGIIVELFIAALGLLLFLAAQPGLVQDIGFNLFLIGGISSLFFNGNPLLKYDGYYILADAVGIPNLFQRSAQYWKYLFRRYLFGLRDSTSPVSAPGEAGWFVCYSLLSVSYRLAIMWFIITLVVGKFFYLGIVLGSWLITIQVLMPLYQAVNFVFTNPCLQRRRGRALATTVVPMLALVAIAVLIPVPSYSVNVGIVQQPDEVHLRAKHDGFVQDVLVKNNQRVTTGTPLLTLHDPFLDSESRVALARLAEVKARYRAGRAAGNYEAGIIKEELQVAESELHYIWDKSSAMSVEAFKNGELVLLGASDLPGRFLRKGDLLGYILDHEQPTVRMAVSQNDIGRLREQVVNVKVRFASEPQREFDASILRQSPEATNQLPDAALSTLGGGPFMAGSNPNSELDSAQKVFLVDLKPDYRGFEISPGTRAYVRVDHGSETLVSQWLRSLRQVFLRQFNV